MDKGSNYDNMNTNRDIMSKTPDVFYRFTKDEMVDQRDNLTLFFLTDLFDDDNIEKTLDEIKKIVGYDLTVDAAMLIRRLTYKKMIGDFDLARQKSK